MGVITRALLLLGALFLIAALTPTLAVDQHNKVSPTTSSTACTTGTLYHQWNFHVGLCITLSL